MEITMKEKNAISESLRAYVAMIKPFSAPSTPSRTIPIHMWLLLWHRHVTELAGNCRFSLFDKI